MINSNEKFIIGLGNPGKEYTKNRHNIGFLLLENFSEKYNAKFTLKNKLKSWYSEFKVKDSIYRLFMPNTFMNNSGDAVREKPKNFNTISHVLGNISSKESLVLDKVYKQLIESLQELNTKNEDYIINEINSFHRNNN